MVPIPTNYDSGELVELRARVLLLERALSIALGRQGMDSGAGEEGLAAARESVAEVDRLVSCGRAPEAARRYRDLFGVTWDEAHTAVARWKAGRSEELARWLRLKRWVAEQGGPPQGVGSGA